MQILGILLTVIGLLALDWVNFQMLRNQVLRPIVLANRSITVIVRILAVLAFFAGAAMLSQTNRVVLVSVLALAAIAFMLRLLGDRSAVTEKGRIRRIISIYKKVLAKDPNLSDADRLKQTSEEYSWDLILKENLSVAPLNAMLTQMWHVLETQRESNSKEPAPGLSGMLFLILTYIDGVKRGMDTLHPDYSGPEIEIRGRLIEYEVERAFALPRSIEN